MVKGCCWVTYLKYLASRHHSISPDYFHFYEHRIVNIKYYLYSIPAFISRHSSEIYMYSCNVLEYELDLSQGTVACAPSAYMLPLF